MARQLKVFEIRDEGAREIATLDADELHVGRDPNGDIPLNSPAVSFRHGMFVRMRNHWFFKDAGSSNGSWLNDKPVARDRWKLIRPGDVLQLADIVLRFAGTEPPTGAGVAPGGGRTLVIFSRNEFLDEYPVPDYGTALSVGGPGADLELPGADAHHSLVIQQTNDAILASPGGGGTPFSVNGFPYRESIPLSDGDEIEVGPYLVFLNDPPRSAAGPLGGHIPVSPASRPTPRSSALQRPAREVPILDPSTPVHRTVTRTDFPFGQPRHSEKVDVDQTMVFNPAELQARIRREGPPVRGRPEELSDDDREGLSRYSLSTLEGKLLVFTGVCLTLALFCLIFWLVAM